MLNVVFDGTTTTCKGCLVRLETQDTPETFIAEDSKQSVKLTCEDKKVEQFIPLIRFLLNSCKGSCSTWNKILPKHLLLKTESVKLTCEDTKVGQFISLMRFLFNLNHDTPKTFIAKDRKSYTNVWRYESWAIYITHKVLVQLEPW